MNVASPQETAAYAVSWKQLGKLHAAFAPTLPPSEAQ
jgi:hypothetical protein